MSSIPGSPQGTGQSVGDCPSCGQRVGIRDGKWNMHQVPGPSRATCEKAGESAE